MAGRVTPRTPSLLVAAILVVAPQAHSGQPTSDLQVSPTRVVLEGPEADAKLTLRNAGSALATYRLSLVRMRMGERGEMSIVEASRDGELFADGFVRLSPAEARVPAGGEQTVRLKAKVPPGLVPGEYRAHLLFRPQTESGRGGGEPARLGGEEGKIRLRPVVGVTVPVLLRIGELSARVRMSGLRLLEGGGSSRLEVTLDRDGTASVYGGLVVQHVSREGRTGTVGGLGGVAVYTPNARRIVEIPIRLPAGAARSAGALRVEYRAADDEGTLLAKGELSLEAATPTR